MRLPALDLLRGISAAAVAGSHCLLYAGIAPIASKSISIMAVEVFFALSGFVLAPQILRIVTNRSMTDLWTFLVRRWMRTVPAYFLALICAWILYSRADLPDLLRYMLYVQNLTTQANTHDYFAVSWSLSVEEWFYVVFPALILVWRHLGRPRSGAIIFILTVAAIRFVFAPSEDWDALVRRITIFRVDAIAYGFLLYFIVERLNLASKPRPALYMTVASGIIFTYITVQIVLNRDITAEQLYPFAASAFSCAVVWLALSCRTFPKLLATLSLQLGRLSYSIYLFHSLLLTLVFSFLPFGPLGISLYLVATAIAADLVSRFIEKPILEARPAYRSPQPKAPSLVLTKSEQH